MRVFAFWVAKGKGVVNGTRNPRVLGSYVYPSYYLYVSTPWVPKLPCCSNQLVVMGVQLGRFSAPWDSNPHGYHSIMNTYFQWIYNSESYLIISD